MAYAVRVWLKKLYFGSKVPEIPFLGVPAPVFATNRPSEWGDFQLDVPESIKEYRTQNFKGIRSCRSTQQRRWMIRISHHMGSRRNCKNYLFYWFRLSSTCALSQWFSYNLSFFFRGSYLSPSLRSSTDRHACGLWIIADVTLMFRFATSCCGSCSSLGRCLCVKQSWLEWITVNCLPSIICC